MRLDSLFCFGEKCFLCSETGLEFKDFSKDPFLELRKFWEKHIQNEKNKILLGFLSYELIGSIDSRLLDSRAQIIPIPKILFRVCDYQEIEAKNLIENLSVFSFEKFHPSLIKTNSLISDEFYAQMILKAQEEIKAGNLYEINLSRPILFSNLQGNSLSIFSHLYKQNPAVYSAFFRIDEQTDLLSFSPECFLKKRGEKLSTFPIKGTRRRDSNDEKQITELLGSIKEQAEHLMVVDIERNDFGQFAKVGSVQVKNFSSVQTLPFLHHLVSEVFCEIREKIDIFDILKFTFPSGSITGAPKFRTMQIIKQIESHPRGAYTGAFGYIDSKGDADFSILIRTMFRYKQTGLLQVGGGIVFDSEPAFEVQETHLKAESFLKALKVEKFK